MALATNTLIKSKLQQIAVNTQTALPLATIQQFKSNSTARCKNTRASYHRFQSRAEIEEEILFAITDQRPLNIMYVPITYTGGKGLRRIHPYDLVITTRGNLAIFGKFVTGTSRRGTVGVRLYLVNQIKSAQADRRSRRFINPYGATVLSKAVIKESKEG